MERIGYGQVEPTHLSAQRNGKIYAQLPAAGLDTIENGMFLKYDYAAGAANLSGEGEWLLVYNEVKTYEDRQTYKDFAMKKADYVDGVMVPRLFKTDVGDIMITNCIKGEVTKNAYVAPAADGYLTVGAKGDGMAWKVVALTTMPDGQEAAKLQRVQ